jgi:hypothetical protein
MPIRSLPLRRPGSTLARAAALRRLAATRPGASAGAPGQQGSRARAGGRVSLTPTMLVRPRDRSDSCNSAKYGAAAPLPPLSAEQPALQRTKAPEVSRELQLEV